MEAFRSEFCRLSQREIYRKELALTLGKCSGWSRREKRAGS
jgi:hypothetical protein